MPSTIWKRMQLIAPLLWVPLGACLSPPVESPQNTVTQGTDVHVNIDLKNKVDVLFMIDNSSSMAPMQAELQARFGDFFQVFQDLTKTGTFADLHIGVVTSDYGAGAGSTGCQPFGGGQHGLLQTMPSPTASPAPQNCVPPRGSPFISYAFNPAGGPPATNLPNGNDVGALIQEFTCMASVGASGCGFEHQLESVYAALKNTKENAGFLRPDALLTVVFVTNEDDGSAPGNVQFYSSGGANPTGGGAYGQWSTYRQTRFAVECGGMPIPYGMPSAGNIAACAGAPNPMAGTDWAFDISRYTDFFKSSSMKGGVKLDPNDVILVGIDAPETPFRTMLALPQNPTPPMYQPCAAPMLSTQCNQVLAHSCMNNVQPVFFGDPSVRLNAVINAIPNHQISSICGDDLNQPPDFSKALQQLGQLISSKLTPPCVNAAIINRPNGTPDCVVEEITLTDDGVTAVEVAACSDNNNTPPCWAVKDLLDDYVKGNCVPPPGPEPDSCKLPVSCQPAINPLTKDRQLTSISMVNGATSPPANTSLRVSCTTIASTEK